MPIITIASEPTGPDAPIVPVEGERPTNIPEKFWNAETKSVNVDAMAASYAELERTRPAAKPDAAAEAARLAAEEAAKTPEQKAADAAAKEAADKAAADAEANPALTPFFKEFEETGALSDDSFSKLDKMGITKEMVELYQQGLAARVDTLSAPVYEAAGGQDAYNTIATWAGAQTDEATKSMVARFNASSTANDGNAALVFAQIRAAHDAAEGTTPTRRVSSTPAASAGDTFPNMAAAVKAMEDPRYRDDSNYRDDVIRRMEHMQ